jgi:hypothetical protein
MRDRRRRIEKLEALLLEEVVLILHDGSRFRYPGPHLRLYCEALEDIRQNRCTPLLEAIRKTIASEEGDLAWQVVRALDASPREG